MNLVLDTCAYCDFAAGVANVVDVLAETEGQLWLSVVALVELRYGFGKGKRPERNDSHLNRFVSESGVRVLDVRLLEK